MSSLNRISIPASDSVVNVQIIDTTFRLSGLPCSYFLGPEVPGFENYSCLAYSFLVTHHDPRTDTNTRLLFDLGPSRNWQEDLPSPLAERIKGWNASIVVQENVPEILERSGVALDSIDALVWRYVFSLRRRVLVRLTSHHSHPHWDHMGKPSLFPPSADLITGPGLQEAFGPGYPENQAAPFKSSAVAGRKITELDFTTSSLRIGGLSAIDYFQDGSLYLLSAPGHAVGHIVALARTTSSAESSNTARPDSTFVLMGGDSCQYHTSSLQ
jgi:hypothetical protein